jgi:hypothetical protein
MGNATASGGLYARRPARRDKPAGSPVAFPKLASVIPLWHDLMTLPPPLCHGQETVS